MSKRYYTPHFSRPECIGSETAEALCIDNAPNEEQDLNLQRVCGNVAEPLRLEIGAALYVSSGFRSEELNAQLRGAKDSHHLRGMALDLKCFSKGTEHLCATVAKMKSLDFTQAIMEGINPAPGSQAKGWLHISYDPDDLRNEFMIATPREGGGWQYERVLRTEFLSRATA